MQKVLEFCTGFGSRLPICALPIKCRVVMQNVNAMLMFVTAQYRGGGAWPPLPSGSTNPLLRRLTRHPCWGFIQVPSANEPRKLKSVSQKDVTHNPWHITSLSHIIPRRALHMFRKFVCLFYLIVRI